MPSRTPSNASIWNGVRRWFGLAGPDDPNPDAAVRKRVVAMSWPAVIEGLLQTAIGIVDTLLVAKVSEEALAGVGTAIQLMFIMVVVMSAISVGASVLVSQSIGGGDRARASLLAKQAIILGMVIAVPLAIVGVATAGPAVRLFGVEPDVAAIGTDYWRITAATAPAMTGMFLISGVLRGAGDTKTPMRATALANVTNAVLAYLLIFGHLGFPELGPAGSAWGAAAGRAVGVALMLFVLLRPKNPVTIRGPHGWRPSWTTSRSIFGIGVPAAVEQLSFSLSFAVLTAIIAVLGTDALAAQRITFNALSLAFLPGIGVAMAASALVGQSVGARDPRAGGITTRVASQYAAVWMGAIGVVFFVLAGPIVRLYSNDPDVVRIGTDALRALAISQPLWGLEIVYGGALRGTGNSRFPMIVSMLWSWSAVILAYVTVSVLDFGLASVWLIFAVTAPITVAAFRLRIGRDEHLGRHVGRVTELEPEPLRDGVPLEEPAA
jgi:putative MATE family efflux protein